MNKCYDQGLLRNYLAEDASLSLRDRATMKAHIAACEDCGAALAELQAVELAVSARLAPLDPPNQPQPEEALQRLKIRLSHEQHLARSNGSFDSVPAPGVALAQPIGRITAPRRSMMQSLTTPRAGIRRAALSGLAALLVLSLVAFPSVRAAADQFLQTFRSQSVVFVPVGSDRLQQLATAGIDPTSLFLSDPTITGGLKHPQTFDSAQAAGQAAGFQLQEPSVFPGAPDKQTIVVADTSGVSVRVDIAEARRILSALGVTDVTLPDALGTAPITADIPPAVVSSYQGAGYQFILAQGHTPTVTLPKGVQLSDLGRAALEVLGMPPDQAATLSRQIDWSSTLVLPFPEGLSNVHQVQVDGAQGMLVSSSSVDPRNVRGVARSLVEPNSGPISMSVLYWQRGDRFYALQGTGTAAQESAMLAAAQSIK